MFPDSMHAGPQTRIPGARVEKASVRAPVALAADSHGRAVARLLTVADLPALDRLERAKWTQDQAATPSQLRQRIQRHPRLSVGSFCPASGRLLASLFARPVPHDFAQRVGTWREAVELPLPASTRSLFGISLSSQRRDAADAAFEMLWAVAMKDGYRELSLGSPLPGWGDWVRRWPSASLDDYVRRRKGRLPIDPQVRYYHDRGFTEVVAAKPGYFPHERSMDNGVILRHTFPFLHLRPLWQAFPLDALARLARHLRRLV